MRTPRLTAALIALALVATGCSARPTPGSPGPDAATSSTGVDPSAGSPGSSTSQHPTAAPTVRPGHPFATRVVTQLSTPWAMTFLPDGRALVTEKTGRLVLLEPRSGATAEVAGAPKVVAAGQGGLQDVVLAPTFEKDRAVYLTWVEDSGDGTTRGVLGRARLDLVGSPRLSGLEPLWQQDPAGGDGQFALRVVVAPDGESLFLTSGDRQKMTPAQDIESNLGKILHLDLEGDPLPDNPFSDRAGRANQVWSYGHRNPLGIAVDQAGNLWSTEMGPRGGDELNLVEPGANYGWPLVSEGTHYDGTTIPSHSTRKDVVAPAASWVPSISPGNLMIYSGSAFPRWKGDAFIGGLSGQTLIRMDLDGASATKADAWDMGARIREVEQGPDGSIWILTDRPLGEVWQLTPPR